MNEDVQSFDIGDRHKVYLDSLTYSNSAVGRIGDVVTFVKGGVAGDTVLSEITKVQKNRLSNLYLHLQTELLHHVLSFKMDVADASGNKLTTSRNLAPKNGY